MKIIFKYPISSAISMPEGAEILSIGIQGGSMFIWALIDPDVTKEEVRAFEIFGTGHLIKDYTHLKFIGRLTMMDTLEWHIFEVLKGK